MSEQFGAIPVRAFGDTRLSAADFRVMGAIAYFDRLGRNGAGCYVDPRKLGELAAVDYTHVNRHTRRLQDFGYLEIGRSATDRRKRVYSLIYNEDRAVVANSGDNPEKGDVASPFDQCGAEKVANSGYDPPEKVATPNSQAIDPKARSRPKRLSEAYLRDPAKPRARGGKSRSKASTVKPTNHARQGDRGGGNSRALTLPMTSAEMTIVRQLTDVTGTWRAEHAKIAESKPTFEPIRLRAVALAALVRVSIELMEDAAGFGQLIENAIGASLALEMDRAGIFGTGSNEPRGAVNTPGVNEISMGPNGAAFTNYDPFLDAIEKVENANGMARTVAYAPRTKRTLAGLKTGISGDQTPLVPPKDFTDLARFTSNQFPVNETKGSATNASTALLGDYAQIAFGVRTALRIEATRWGDEKAFSQLEVLIRGYLRVDVAVLRPAHLTKITGIKP